MKSFARPPKNDHVPSLPEQVGMILIGVFAGGLAVAFHAVINLAEKTREQLAVLADSHSLPDLYTALGRVHTATESTGGPFARPRRDG
jgi:hypothetical protein